MPKIKYKTVRISDSLLDYLETREVGVSYAAKFLGMGETSLKISKIPCRKTKGGHRRYSLREIINIITILTDSEQQNHS